MRSPLALHTSGFRTLKALQLTQLPFGREEHAALEAVRAVLRLEQNSHLVKFGHHVRRKRMPNAVNRDHLTAAVRQDLDFHGVLPQYLHACEAVLVGAGKADERVFWEVKKANHTHAHECGSRSGRGSGGRGLAVGVVLRWMESLVFLLGHELGESSVEVFFFISDEKSPIHFWNLGVEGLWLVGGSASVFVVAGAWHVDGSTSSMIEVVGADYAFIRSGGVDISLATTVEAPTDSTAFEVRVATLGVMVDGA